MSQSVRCLLMLVCVVILGACSHLHVDLDSRWRLAHDAHVAIEVEQPPAEVSVDQVAAVAYQLGWQRVDAGSPADARLLCRWQRVVDLNDDSEPIQTVKSFHARLVDAQSGRLLGVADYFYGTGEDDFYPGVESALQQLYARISVVPEAPQASSVSVVDTLEPANVVAPTEPIVAPQVAPIASAPVTTPVVAPVVAPVATPAVPIDPVVPEPAVSAAVETIPPAVVTPKEPSSAVIELSEAPLSSSEETTPQSMDTSPWIPRFQGMGLESWGKEDDTLME